MSGDEDKTEPKWLKLARGQIGTHEAAGTRDNPDVLKFYADAGHPEIKHDEVPWCFTGDTEILTDQGFTRFDKLNDDAVVYQADDAGRLSLTSFTKVVKSYDGEVFDIAHRSVKLTCDIGHRWYGHWGRDQSPDFKTLDDMTADGLSIPAVKSSSRGLDLSDREIQLVAAFISDGKYKNGNRSLSSAAPWSIEFEVSRERKIAALNLLSPGHVYRQKRACGPITKTPLSVFRFVNPPCFANVFHEYKRLSREFINGLSQRQAVMFLEAYAVFDGNGGGNNTILYTSDRATRDDLVTIAVLAGYHPSIQGGDKHKSPLSGRPSWAISFARNKSCRHFRRKHISRRHFNGTLYCVRVPHGRIVVRGLDGAPVLTGNCAAFVGAMLERSGTPSAKTLSARDYLTWGKKLDEPRLGCVCVFSRGDARGWQGHVGFYAGERNGQIELLGGNQADSVSITHMPKSRLLGYRWPVTGANSRTLKATAVNAAGTALVVAPTIATVGTEFKGLGEYGSVFVFVGATLCILASIAIIWARMNDLQEKGR